MDEVEQLKQVKQWLLASDELQRILAIVASLDLPDCWLSAGSIRNYLWNCVLGTSQVSINDVDVVYFDRNVPYEVALQIEETLCQQYPEYRWEVRNQAHMHQHNFQNEVPYRNTKDAISKYPEQCTAIAARLNKGQLELLSPWGVADIFELRVQPTPHFMRDASYFQVYLKRQAQKKWQQKWPQLTISYKIEEITD